jgi:hypothetical protein
MEKETIKNKGGRPRISESEKSKFEVKCYLTKSEKIAFDNYKNEHKYKSSEVVRNAVLNHLKITKKNTKKLSPELLQELGDLKQLGSLVNQSLRHLNYGLQLSGKSTIHFIANITTIQQKISAIESKIKGKK